MITSNLTKRLYKSVEECLKFICIRQLKSGNWIDWDLPIGQSDAWITSYIGYNSRLVPHNLEYIITKPLEKAITWINKNIKHKSGWGYNGSAGIDADSTSYNILFLKSQKINISNKSYRLLRKFQQTDGGFSTYYGDRENDSWNVSHPDVTPIVLLAMLTKLNKQHKIILRGLDYILKNQNRINCWDSFWWDSFLYSTAVNLSFLDSIEFSIKNKEVLNYLLQTKPKNAFESALLINCLLLLKIPIEHPSINDQIIFLLKKQVSCGFYFFY